MKLQDRLVIALGNLERKVSPYLPFSLPNVVWQSLDKASKASLLDVGCGKGEPMKFINRRRQFFTVGIDIFKPALQEAKRQGTHNEYVLSDVRRLPFRRKSLDIVLCMEVLEHLDKGEGFALLQALEDIARRQVIVTTPVGIYRQDAFDGNPHQEHKTVWSPDELRGLGYKIKGVKIRGTSFTTGLLSHLPRLLRVPIHIAWYLAGPLVYFLPELSGDMICSKKLDSAC